MERKPVIRRWYLPPDPYRLVPVYISISVVDQEMVPLDWCLMRIMPPIQTIGYGINRSYGVPADHFLCLSGVSGAFARPGTQTIESAELETGLFGSQSIVK